MTQRSAKFAEKMLVGDIKQALKALRVKDRALVADETDSLNKIRQKRSELPVKERLRKIIIVQPLSTT